MKKVDAVVIGGSAADMPAAITCRRHYPDKSIMLIRKEKKVLIPHAIGREPRTKTQIFKYICSSCYNT